MPSDLVATKGGETSNCYCTLNETDEYLDNLYGAEEWAELDDNTKRRLILTATRQIDGFKTKLGKLASTQLRNFPVNDTGDDGFAQAKEANIIQALFIFQTSDTVNEARIGGIQGVSSETIGPTNKSVIGFNQYRMMHPNVFSLLAPYVEFVPKLKRA